MGGHTAVGHPFLEEKNHASKGIHKTMELGGGGRFSNLTHMLQSRGKSAGSAGAIAASIGRKKYGNKKMTAMSVAGRKG